MSAGRRLFIIDPSLSDIRGHHYTLTRSITESARAKGFAVFWLSSANLSEELQEWPEIHPTFRMSMYDAYKKTRETEKAAPAKEKPIGKRLLGRLKIFGNEDSSRDTGKPGANSGEPDFAAVEDSIADGIRQAIKTHHIGPADRLLFHTADGATYKALHTVLQSWKSADIPLIHVCTPYDPVGVMPNRQSASEVQEVIDFLKDRNLIDNKVFLYAENPYLAGHLSAIWGARVRRLDLPMNAVNEDEKFLARKYKTEQLGLHEKTFVITTLGAARLEKGFNLIPDIIRRTFEFAGTLQYPNANPARIKFVLQASAQIVGRHPVIASAIERMEELPAEQVQLLTEPLSDRDYRNLLLASDCVLMPYDEKAYRVRGSGVVTEAVTARKFIVAKSGSYPAKMAEWQGGGTGETPKEMALSLLGIINKRWERFESIKTASHKYLGENNIEGYVPKLIEAEREGARNRTARQEAVR